MVPLVKSLTQVADILYCETKSVKITRVEKEFIYDNYDLIEVPEDEVCYVSKNTPVIILNSEDNYFLIEIAD